MFRLNRFLSILNARNKEFYRDIGALSWTFIFPFIIIFGFSYMFNVDSKKTYKLGYVKEDLVEHIGDFNKAELLHWIEFVTEEEVVNKLRHHQIDLFIKGNGSNISYMMNESSPRSKVAEKLFLYEVRDKKLDIEKWSITGRRINYIDWLFPGLITMNVMWMALWGVGWVIVRQRKLGVLKRYKVSPLSAFEYILAQVVSRLFILVASGIILFLGGFLIYPFIVEGAFFDILVVYVLGCFSLSSLGLIIAARISSDEFANGILNIISFPMMFLSEIWFSLEGSSGWVKVLANFMPLWHMTDAIRKIMNEGATLFDVRWSVFVLICISVVCTYVGSKAFKWVPD